MLLRADRAAYVVGETMHLTALTPVASGSVYLDIVRTGQTLSTRSAEVESGRAEFAVCCIVLEGKFVESITKQLDTNGQRRIGGKNVQNTAATAEGARLDDNRGG